ncbi:peptidoglycan -binding protein [Paracoccus sp. p3-h83]|uniref:peptidoglycan -binding protein n=1 Tax=Paracoccus sp. p3-h83 TaxID=3342805 RepID=UPI0035B88E3D
MALGRRGAGRLHTNIWPGFVDALATLLMVLTFVLTIFTVVQSVLRDRITAQDSQLDRLTRDIAGLSDALSVEKDQTASLTSELTASQQAAADRAAEAARLAEALRAQEAALTGARSEIDAAAEAARLAAARREALEALVADLQAKGQAGAAELAQVQTRLSDAEAARLADAAAAEALRQKLAGAETELTAMTLSLEESRKRAEETLTLLAAAEAAKARIEADAAAKAGEVDQKAALLAAAEAAIAQEKALTADEARKVALLNAQIADLRGKLATVQSALDLKTEAEAAQALEVQDLGQRLNAALLAKTQAETARAALEEAARKKAEAEARDLARYRSEFFGRLSQILAGRPGVKVVGDRFVFDSNVLFQPGAADLSPAGRDQVAQVAQMLTEVSATIPPEIDWVIRVDGHTDDQPLSGLGRYRDNWELSQARALAVVRYLTQDLGFPADRLAATGFGDTRPAQPNSSPKARAANRRIELKLTER